MMGKIKGALFGLAVGDALGVPVEFRPRQELSIRPVNTMRAFGSWNQPAGTWSDDSSLAFCLAESLAKGYDLNDIAQNFVNWMQHGYWGAHHKVFDIGGTTRFSIGRLTKGISPSLSGAAMEDDNGNGSLMRIMPLLFYIKGMPITERYARAKEVSAITHGHFRSVFSCFIYLELALRIFNGHSAEEAYYKMRHEVLAFANQQNFLKKEIEYFKRILHGDIKTQHETAIHSSGYVLRTLEASIWCLLNTDNYAGAVLKAVNLGDDTDTTGCVTGGLAGLLYGYDDIPISWIETLARKEDISNLCERLNQQILK